MIDWTKSMSHTYEFYKVDPYTWKNEKRINNIVSCKINRDESNETLGSASFDCFEALDEMYIRTYLVANQNGVSERFPLGTHLIQTPSINFDGTKSKVSMDAYTPLIELKENRPPIGYSILKDMEIMPIATEIFRGNMRAPVVGATSTEKLYNDFVANTNDTWLSFGNDLIYNAKFKLALDELGRTLFEPVQDVASLRPVYRYTTDNSSILYPDVTNDRDLYGIPNVVEVVYSTDAGYLYAKVVNDDPNSPISTVNRGREVVHRTTSLSVSGKPNQAYINEYAYQLLRNLSCLEHKITYKHGFIPNVRIGDCVILEYPEAGLSNVKAKVTSQSISCVTGCPVEETAVYTTKLWR